MAQNLAACYIKLSQFLSYGLVCGTCYVLCFFDVLWDTSVVIGRVFLSHGRAATEQFGLKSVLGGF